MPKWWNGSHAGLRNQCPLRRASSSLAFGTPKHSLGEMDIT